MKSAIFESLNDRSNIANAYMRMVNETAEEISAIAELFKDKKYPLTVIDDSKDPPECVIDLEDIEDEYLRYVNDGIAWETKDYDDRYRYYISLAFDKVGIDEVYKKILEEDSNFCLSPAMIHTMNDSMVNTIEELKSTIAQIGKDWEEDLHKDDMEVAIPKWAENYLENGDDTDYNLTQDDYDMVDNFVREWGRKGYELVRDGTDLGFGKPKFGDACNRVRYYLMKRDEGNSNLGESIEPETNRISPKRVYELLKPIDRNIASIASYGIEKGKSIDEIISDLASMSVNGATRTSDAVHKAIDVLRKGFNKGGKWFDESGLLRDKLPHLCIKDCTRPGIDATAKCREWVRTLGFDDGLDIPLAKGYLKNTGGFTDDELRKISPDDTAMTLLWVICGDIKDGIWPISLDSGNYHKDDFADNEETMLESTYIKHHVILDNGESMIIEVIDDEDVEDEVDGMLKDTYGYVPEYRILKDRVLGRVDVDDEIRRPRSRRSSRRRKNEVVSQSEVDKLKKRNPKLKEISEQM